MKQFVLFYLKQMFFGYEYVLDEKICVVLFETNILQLLICP